MSLQMNYTDGYGSTLASSYWSVTEIKYNKLCKKVQFEMHGYVNAQAKTDGKKAIANRSYFSDSYEWDAYFTTAILDAVNNNIIKQCYDMAKTRKDTLKDGYSYQEKDPQNPDPEKDDNWLDSEETIVSKDDAHESFFTGAIDV